MSYFLSLSARRAEVPSSCRSSAGIAGGWSAVSCCRVGGVLHLLQAGDAPCAVDEGVVPIDH
eukprot:12907185-Heterocapsa_arctica.AAC.1